MGVGLYYKKHRAGSFKTNRNRTKIPKTAKQMERHFKGIANHWRIEILLYISNHPGVSVEAIAKGIDCHFKTVSEHVIRLAQAGLIDRKYQGRSVIQNLSPYGCFFVDVITKFRQPK